MVAVPGVTDVTMAGAVAGRDGVPTAMPAGREAERLRRLTQ